MITARATTVVVCIVFFIIFVLFFFTTGQIQDWMIDNLDVVRIIIILLVITAAAIAGWQLKRAMKRRMERGLGREVEDSELTSIATWMKIPEEAKKAAKDADEYDFDR
jgi:SNF family Na+-dependent transporter